MSNHDNAKYLLADADKRLSVAQQVLQEGYFPLAFRLSQECVELSLKALLIYGALDPPKWHDVGQTLQQFRPRFPQLTDAELAEMSAVSARLRAKREVSMYGSDDFKLPPSAFIDQAEAAQAVSDAERVITNCRRAMRFP
jgi:hypothetical protein